jgi:signal transduction histidine kinase
VQRLVREILSAAESEASSRNIEVLVDVAADLTADVPVRPFGEALEGLVRNAVENTPDESRIVIKAQAEDDGVLTVMIQDHGVGITAENLQHIFEGFFHTQETERYSSRRPFDFDAGGKGLICSDSYIRESLRLGHRGQRALPPHH